MAYSPAAHNTATSGRAGFVRLGSGVSGNSDGSIVSNATLLGLSKSSVGLGNVENTALSTWGGSTSITTLGTVTSGSAPASDVYSWAKQSTKPTYTKSEVGLGNVENTALSTWAGSSNITTLGTVTSGSAPASDVYSWAKAASKPSYTNSEVGLGNVGNYTVNQNVGSSDSPTFNIVYASQFLYTSDAVMKTNIENITGTWDVIDRLRPVSFDWKNSQKNDYGFIAQELKEVLPNSVGSNGDTLGITPSAIIAHLVAAVKDLKSQVETLTKRLED